MRIQIPGYMINSVIECYFDPKLDTTVFKVGIATNGSYYVINFSKLPRRCPQSGASCSDRVNTCDIYCWLKS